MDFSTTARNERRDSQVEEVSEFFNTGFSLGKRKSSDGMEISMFEPITMPHSKCSRQRLETNAPSKTILSHGKDANDRLEISSSPMHSNPEVQMEVIGNGSQQQNFNCRVTPWLVLLYQRLTTLVLIIIWILKTVQARYYRKSKVPDETNVLSRNHIGGPVNSVIYHRQHVARRHDFRKGVFIF